PSKPYIVRAYYEWIADNNLTPYIVVNVDTPFVEVPMQYVENGKITLNISMTATQGLVIGNDGIQFKARFAGIPMSVYCPIQSIMAIYAKENGKGKIFTEEDNDFEGYEPPATHTLVSTSAKPSHHKPTLSIVKGNKDRDKT